VQGPSQPGVRCTPRSSKVRAILDHAQLQVTAAARETGAGQPRLHRAEQVLLLTRLAADSGARRGELAALQLGDLDGDILTIARAASNEVVGPTKSGRIRRLTLGPTTAALWLHTVTQWRHADALIRTYRPVATPPAGRGRNDVCGHDGGRSRTQLRCARRRNSAAAPVMITNPTTATIKPTAAEPCVKASNRSAARGRRPRRAPPQPTGSTPPAWS
jgi:integrase